MTTEDLKAGEVAMVKFPEGEALTMKMHENAGGVGVVILNSRTSKRIVGTTWADSYPVIKIIYKHGIQGELYA